MSIESFVSVRAIRELLSKVLPERKFIDRHMINTVRIRARQRKRESLNANIEIYPKHFGLIKTHLIIILKVCICPLFCDDIVIVLLVLLILI